MSNLRNSPIIIIGMHRSGTSMITRTLHKAGLYIGNQLDDNHESIFFMRLNEWMLSQTNSSWDRPDNFQFVNEKLANYFEDILLSYLTLKSRDAYLDTSIDMAIENVFQLTQPWGWKDPRNTLTLPYWLKIFPNARIIHIIRHPLDVAESLSQREKKHLEEMSQLKNNGSDLTHIGGIKLQLSPRCFELDQGITLWTDYVNAGIKAETLVKPHNYLRVYYEDFLQQPENKVDQLLEFCSLTQNKHDLATLTHNIKPDRAYAYRKNPELSRLYENIRSLPLQKELGYSEE